jgi:hypothetical protein
MVSAKITGALFFQKSISKNQVTLSNFMISNFNVFLMVSAKITGALFFQKSISKNQVTLSKFDFVM